MADYYVDLENGVDYTGLSEWSSGGTYEADTSFVTNVFAAWSSTTAYVINDYVKFGTVPEQKIYKCIVDHTNQSPTDWSSYWQRQPMPDMMRVYKCIQNTSSPAAALTDTAYWELVADGSASKPFKSVTDATRWLNSVANSVRVAKTEAPVLLTGSYTFNETGTYAGKVTVGGSNPDSLAVNDYIGNMDIGIFKITGVTGSNPTIITISPTFFTLDATASVTPSSTYKYVPITLSATQALKSHGSPSTTPLDVSGGWNLSDPGNPVRDGYTRIAGKAFSSDITLDYYNLSYFHWCGVTPSIYVTSGTISNCITSACTLGSVVSGYARVSDCLLSTDVWENWRTLPSCNISNCIMVNATHLANEARNTIFDNCKIGNWTNQTFISRGVPVIFKNCNLRINSSGSSSISWNYIDINESNVINSFAMTTFTGKNTRINIALTPQDYRLFYNGGQILSDITTRHSTSGFAWRYEPNNNSSSATPLTMTTDIFDTDFLAVAVAANIQVTSTIWCKKSDADSAFEAQFICKGGQLAGIANDVTAVATDSTDWQQLTIQVTPTEAGVLRFGFQVWGSATATCHIDDFGVTQ